MRRGDGNLLDNTGTERGDREKIHQEYHSQLLYTVALLPEASSVLYIEENCSGLILGSITAFPITGSG